MSVVHPEVRRLVVIARRALDLFFFRQQPFELGIGFLHERRDGFVDFLGSRRDFDGLRSRSPACGRRATDDTSWLGATGGVARGKGRGLRDVRRCLVGHDVAAIDPDLDANAAVGGLGLTEAVVDLGAKGVQGNPALAVPLGAAHLGAAQPAAALHADAQGTRLLRVLHRALHGTTEGNTAGELIGNALCDQRRVELGLLDLLDVELHAIVASDLGEALSHAIGFGASAADDDARARGMHVDAQAITRALDFDATDRGMRQLHHDEVADLPVLDDVVGVRPTVSEPTRLPISRDSETESVRIDLLPHYSAPSSASSPSVSLWAAVPGAEKPAFSASSIVSKHTSALVGP